MREQLLTDEELYQRLPSENAFRCLYDRYSGPLLRFVIRFTRNQEIAEEILHDIFTQLLDQRFVSSGEGSLKAWLFTLARNKSLNCLRKAEKEVKNEEAYEGASVESDLEVRLYAGQIQHRFALVEGRLPQELQKTWALRKAGMDYTQISEQLKVPVGTVKSRFHRLVELFRQEFENEI